MRLYYSPSYACDAFDTTRKARWIAESLRQYPIVGVEVCAPVPLAFEDVERMHNDDYALAIMHGQPRALASTPGFEWTPDLWDSVCASNGGMIAATMDALRSGMPCGSLSAGMHHARREEGAGFCTFNGLALAAERALSWGVSGQGRVLIIDLDAHAGGGTHQMLRHFGQRVHIIDLCTSDFDAYAPGPGRECLGITTDPVAYLAWLQDALSAHRPDDYDVVIYNAGMDPHEDCPIGGKPGFMAHILAQRDRMVFRWAHRRVGVAFGLAGGYVGTHMLRERLVGLHRITIAEAAASARWRWYSGLSAWRKLPVKQRPSS